jgi:signal transduction histidine kinase
MMIMQPWPPDGTIVGIAPDPRDPGSRPSVSADAAQLVEDLRTIATCVLGFTELLRGSELSGQDRQTYLGVLNDQATRLARIVEHLDAASADGSDALPKLPG